MNSTKAVEKFGDYYLLKQIAGSGIADIYIAIPDEVSKRENLCIIKKIKKEYSTDKRFVVMLIDEAKISALLDHPNIGEIYDLGYVKNDFFISMAYIEGQNLSTLLASLNREEEKIYPDIAIYITLQILSGLDFAHNFRDSQDRSLKIIHRDISPHNIMLGYNGDVKILDFGLAIPEKRLLTNNSMLFGKLPYMPPEAITLSSYDNRYDIYSCGIILYEMLSGFPPFRGSSQLELRNKIIEEYPKMLQDFNDKINDIIFKSIAKNPSDRFRSADEFEKELLKLSKEYVRQDSKSNLSRLLKMRYHDKSEELKEELNKKISELSCDLSSINFKQNKENKRNNSNIETDFHKEETLLDSTLSNNQINTGELSAETEVMLSVNEKESQEREQPYISSEKKKCQYHPVEYLSGNCKNCGKDICVICEKKAKNKPYCPMCSVIINKKSAKRERIKKIYKYLAIGAIIIIFTTSIFAFKYFNKKPLSFVGIQAQEIALIEFVAPVIDINNATIKILNGENPSFEDKSIIRIKKYFEAEFKRYSGNENNIINITPIGPFKLKEKFDPPRDFLSKALFVSLLKKLSMVNRINLTNYDGAIFIFLGSDGQKVVRPSGISRFFIHEPTSYLFLSVEQKNLDESVLLITHEIAHIFGASDKYKKNGRARYPYGYMNPFQRPLYPQNRGEIMSLAIPLTEDNFKESMSLSDYGIGAKTAYELGWISKTNMKRYYRR